MDSFQVGRIEVGDDNPYSRGEVVDSIGNTGSQGSVEKSNFVEQNKAEAKCICINKVVMRGQHDGRSSHTFSGNSSPLHSSLKCLCPQAQHIGNMELGTRFLGIVGVL